MYIWATLKQLLNIGLVIALVSGFSSCQVIEHIASKRIEPSVPNTDHKALDLNEISSTEFVVGDSRIAKNDYGHWDMYVAGDGYERGLKMGKLESHLLLDQEQYFLDFIEETVPSERYLNFLKYFVAFFNRKLPDHIPLEYQQEIYGVSKSLPKEFEHVGPGYFRALNYHAAHDIGHALQNMNLVACTSFGVWDEKTEDGELLLGRNLDFHVGDEFAEEKIMAFVEPDNGHNFMFVTWPGMVGACSGMNEHGLCVTINAAKSAIPLKTGTPISLLIREILQYARNIDEAHEIAQSRDVFVAESILVGSAEDHKAVLIEVAPWGVELHETGQNQITCSNHFQSDKFSETKRTRKNMEESSSVYRSIRLQEWMDSLDTIGPSEAALILRDRKGHNWSEIGNGNENAINQLIAHHSVIFKPESRLVWVSANPFTLGEYVCYDLNQIFSDKQVNPIDSLTIPADPWLDAGYEIHEEWKWIKSQIEIASKENSGYKVAPDALRHFPLLNLESFQTYLTLGDYYTAKGHYTLALDCYNIAAEKNVPRLVDEELIQEKIKKAKRKVK